MKAIVQDRYGSADVLELREVERPVPAAGEVLVRVRASSVNAADWHIMRGDPYFARLQLLARDFDDVGIRRRGTVSRRRRIDDDHVRLRRLCRRGRGHRRRHVIPVTVSIAAHVHRHRDRIGNPANGSRSPAIAKCRLKPATR